MRNGPHSGYTILWLSPYLSWQERSWYITRLKQNTTNKPIHEASLSLTTALHRIQVPVLRGIAVCCPLKENKMIIIVISGICYSSTKSTGFLSWFHSQCLGLGDSHLQTTKVLTVWKVLPLLGRACGLASNKINSLPEDSSKGASFSASVQIGI